MREVIKWGFLTWLFGDVLGIVFFMFVPASMIGWFVTPFGVVFSLWVLFKKLKLNKTFEYFQTGVIWTTIAILLDFLFIVKLLKPADGYYKPDVYVYYLLTFLIPVGFGYFKRK